MLTVYRNMMLAATLSVLQACKVYDPSLVAECAGRVPPSRPSTAGANEERTVSIALRDLVLDQSSNWAQIGYNLDGYCTSMTRQRGDCMPRSMIRIDGDDGIDNELGRTVFDLVRALQPQLEATAQAGLRDGRSNPVIRISRWNGQRNDGAVTVEIFSLAALVPGDAPPPLNLRGGVPYINDSLAPMPRWDGNDWGFAPNSSDAFTPNFGDPNAARAVLIDTSAYVTGGTLVASIPQGLQITFPGVQVGLIVRLLGGVITAQIEENDRLSNVIVAGRWAVSDLLRTAGNVGVCPGSSSYDLVEATLNNTADVFADTRNRGMSLNCDAVSVGLRFERGVPLRLAPSFLLAAAAANPCQISSDASVDR